MGKLFSGLLGLSTPKASTAPVEEVTEDKKVSKLARRSLFETEGGVTGEELDPSKVKQRNTLLGN